MRLAVGHSSLRSQEEKEKTRAKTTQVNEILTSANDFRAADTNNPITWSQELRRKRSDNDIERLSAEGPVCLL